MSLSLDWLCRWPDPLSQSKTGYLDIVGLSDFHQAAEMMHRNYCPTPYKRLYSKKTRSLHSNTLLLIFLSLSIPSDVFVCLDISQDFRRFQPNFAELVL